MTDFLREILVVAAASQVGLDLKFFGAPDSVILAGMIGAALFGFYLIVRREREEW